MDRLTIRNSDGTVSQPTDLRWDEALEKLAAYEDAEEAGRLLLVPEGIFQTDGERIYESAITNIVFTTKGIAFDADAIGKIVFFTREEAEAAMRRMRGDNDETDL